MIALRCSGTPIFVYSLISTLVIAAVTVAISMRNFALQVPSSDRVAPKYLKLDTSYSDSPSVVTLALVILVLFNITHDFSVLSSIAYAMAISTCFFLCYCQL